MIACGVAGAGVAAAVGEPGTAGGFSLGAALAILSYYWLHQSIQKVFAAGHARLPKRVLVKMLLRYPLAIGAVFLFYRTGWLPFGAILAGLFVPLAGVLMEAILCLGEGFRSGVS